MTLLANHIHSACFLIVFARDEGSKKLKDMRAVIRRHNQDLIDNDVCWVEVIGYDEVLIDGAAADEELSSEALRAEYGVMDHEFAIVLVGKDGAVHQHNNEPLDDDGLVSLIQNTPAYTSHPGDSAAPY